MDIVKNAVYMHYKGNKYKVIELATHTETMEQMVIYQDVLSPDKIWARPLSMWNEEVTLKGKTVKRFELIKNSEGE